MWGLHLQPEIDNRPEGADLLSLQMRLSLASSYAARYGIRDYDRADPA
jgi:hypothetical protein